MKIDLNKGIIKMGPAYYNWFRNHSFRETIKFVKIRKSDFKYHEAIIEITSFSRSYLNKNER